MKRLLLWTIIILGTLIMSRTAFVKEKIKLLSRQTRQQIHDVYLRLQKEAENIGKRQPSLSSTYERLRTEYEKSPEWLFEQRRKQTVANGISSSDNWGSVAEKVSGNLVQPYLDQWTEEQLRKNSVMRGVAGANNGASAQVQKRSPSSVSLKMNGNKNTIDLGKVHITHEVGTNKSLFEIELDQQIRSGMSYEPGSQTMTWSFSAGF